MSSRHPARLAVYVAGEVFYPRELTEVDGKLYIIDEDGTSRILNDYKITTLQDGDGINIDTIHPTTQKTIKMPNASESVRGMVKLGSTAPKAATDTASKGSSTAVSREDHTHPAQVNISGNSETTTAFKDMQEIKLEGDVTGSDSSTGGWSIMATLKPSGVTAGSYGPSANASPDHEEGFVVPQITVDAKGRVTSVVNRTITLPSDADTKYTHPSSPASGNYGPADNAAPDHGETFSVPFITVNALGHVTAASTKTVKLPAQYEHPTNGANKSVGPASNATPDHGEEFVVPQVTIDSMGHVTSANARTIKLPAQYEHPIDGANGTFGPAADATPGFGGNFTIPQVVVDEKGHVTGVTNRTITLPPKPNTDLEDIGAEGSYGPATNVEDYTFTVPSFEVDSKGRVIEASDKTIVIPSKSKEVFEATLNPASAYQAGTDSPCIYTLAISGMLSKYNPMVDLVLSDDYSTAQEELSEFGKIYSIETHDGSVIISTTDVLNTSIPLKLKFVCIISPKSIENFTVAMPISDWAGSEAPYSKTIAVSGIFESDTPIVDLILPDDYSSAQDQLIEFNKVYKIDVVDNSITLYATEVPTAEVTMKLMCIR